MLALSIILVLSTFFAFFYPGWTGLLSYEEYRTYSQSLDLGVRDSSTYVLNFVGSPSSLALSGFVQGKGNARVYAEIDGKKYLLIDTKYLDLPLDQHLLFEPKPDVTQELEVSTSVEVITEHSVSEEGQNQSNQTLELNQTELIPTLEASTIKEKIERITTPTVREYDPQEKRSFREYCLETCAMPIMTQEYLKLIIEVDKDTELKLTKYSYAIGVLGGIAWQETTNEFAIPPGETLHLDLNKLFKAKGKVSYLATSAENLEVTLTDGIVTIVPDEGLSAIRSITLIASSQTEILRKRIVLLIGQGPFDYASLIPTAPPIVHIVDSFSTDITEQTETNYTVQGRYDVYAKTNPELQSIRAKLLGQPVETRIKGFSQGPKELNFIVDNVNDLLISTDVIVIPDYKAEETLISLTKLAPGEKLVTSMVQCLEWYQPIFTCSRWEKIELPFQEEEKYINFTPNASGVYAGAELAYAIVSTESTAAQEWVVHLETKSTEELRIVPLPGMQIENPEYTTHSDALRVSRIVCGDIDQAYTYVVNHDQEVTGVKLENYNCPFETRIFFEGLREGPYAVQVLYGQTSETLYSKGAAQIVEIPVKKKKHEIPDDEKVVIQSKMNLFVDKERVRNFKVGNGHGSIQWKNEVNTVNKPYDEAILVGDGVVSVDTELLSGDYKTSAIIQIKGTSCEHPIFYAKEFYLHAGDVIRKGQRCSSESAPSCKILRCVNNIYTVDVSHFSSFAAGSNANLTINSNAPKLPRENVTFNASYVNSTSGAFIGSATCNITIDSGSAQAMAEIASTRYEFNNTFFEFGSHTYEISCGKSGFDTLTASETITVTQTTGSDFIFLDIANGVPVVFGETTDMMGDHVASGDINNDGIDDLVMGHRLSDAAAADAGAVYVLFGRSNLSGTRDVDTTTDFNFRITGDSGDQLGYIVAVGDLNNDSIDDIATTAGTGDGSGNLLASAGDVYVFYGPITANRTLANANVTLYGSSASENFGSHIAFGDWNGDRADDIAIGAPQDDNTTTNTGRVYVEFGPVATGTTFNYAAASPDVSFDGTSASDFIGSVVAFGDLNNDSYEDLMVSNPFAATEQVYIIYGRTRTAFPNQINDTQANITINDGTGTNFGSALATGDVNDDGKTDLAIADYSAGPSTQGEVYIIFGNSSISTALDMSTDYDVVIIGNDATDQLGRPLSVASSAPDGSPVSIGDVNKDGTADIVMGAAQAEFGAAAATGEVYVVYGHTNLARTINFSAGVNPDSLIVETSATASDSLGTAVAIGDFDNDTVNDVLTSAVQADNSGTNDGGVYPVFVNTLITSCSPSNPPLRTGRMFLDRNFTSTSGTCLNLDKHHTMVDCAGFTINGNSTATGVAWISSNNISVINCNLNNLAFGIGPANSFDNRIRYNRITNTSTDGIAFTTGGPTGNTTVFSNNISGSGRYGLSMIFSTSINNNISFNNILNSRTAGVHITSSSSNNTFGNNTFASNVIGVQILSGSGNIFYFNNFTNHSKVHANVTVASNFFNITDSTQFSGYQGRGNFWDDVASLNIQDTGIIGIQALDGFGDNGTQYPYSAVNGGRVYGGGTGNNFVQDYGPIIINTSQQAPSGCQLLVISSDRNQTTDVVCDVIVVNNSARWFIKNLLNINATINLTVAAGSQIVADLEGFNASFGPGHGNDTSAGTGAGGAGHGGYGGSGESGAGVSTNRGVAYGSALNPNTLGSGGGKESITQGGAGGGAVRINVGNTFTINGVVSANAGNGSNSVNGGAGGGSGGSIFVNTSSLAGNGVFQAKGGNGGIDSDGASDAGGGSGGHIAVYYNGVTGFNGLFNSSVAGGNATPNARDGQPGTMIFVDKDDNNAIIIEGFRFLDVDKVNGGFFYNIVNITNASVFVNTTTLLNVSRNLEVINSKIELERVESLEPRNIAAVYNFSIVAGLVHLNPSIITGISFIEINATNLTLDAGSFINASMSGFNASEGVGKGTNSSSGIGAGGAGHGGYGGSGESGAGVSTNRGVAYGSALNPTTLGSGGGTQGSNNAVGGRGGGMVRIIVTNNFTNNGQVLCDGQAGGNSVNGGAGGGSGGSIFVNTSSLVGSGIFRANGGNGGIDSDGASDAGGGSGGHVAIYYNGATGFNGILNSSVSGGNATPSARDGQPGTMIFVDKDDNNAIIIEGFRFLDVDKVNGGFFYNIVNITNASVFVNTTTLLNVSRNLEVINSKIELERVESLEPKNIAAVYNFSIVAGLVHLNPSIITGISFIEINATNLTLDAGSFINASMSGFNASDGVGKGTNSSSGTGAGGAGHGGYGGDGEVGSTSGNNMGVPYGSAFNPNTFGSGGGTQGSNAAVGGRGGGMVRIVVTDNFTNNGQVLCDGQAGANHNSNGGGGGGGGGSIFVNTSSLAGSGVFQAKGGDGGFDFDTSSDGGGGSGGHITVYYNHSYFNGLFNSSVAGGLGNTTPTTAVENGEGGTLIFIDVQNNAGASIRDALIIQSFRWVPEDQNVFTFTNLNISNASTQLNVSTNISVSQRFDLFATSFDNSDARASNNQVFKYNVTINAPIISLQGANISGIGLVDINTSNITIDANSNILSSITGFIDGQGPGKGTSYTLAGGGAGGAGYGGKGGNGDVAGGSTYDDPVFPVQFGSGGGNFSTTTKGGRGGGLIHITAAGFVNIQGNIKADGEGGRNSSNGGSGGGSGGAVSINSTNITIAGILSSFGGYGGNRSAGGTPFNGGGGGGGRIALCDPTMTSQTLTISGTLTAQGGRATLNAQNGTNGTISRLQTYIAPSDSFTTNLNAEFPVRGNLSNNDNVCGNENITYRNVTFGNLLRMEAQFVNGTVNASTLVIRASVTSPAYTIVNFTELQNFEVRHSIFVKNTSGAGVFVCPSAKVPADLTRSCAGEIEFTEAEAIAGTTRNNITISFSTTSFSNGQYVISNLTGSGVQENATASAQCGDSISSDTTISSNLTATGTCFEVSGPATITCGTNVGITGNGSGVAFNIRNTNTVVIQNCITTRFESGFNITTSTNIVFINDTSLNNTDTGFRYQSVNNSRLLNSTTQNNIGSATGVRLTTSNNVTIDRSNLTTANTDAIAVFVTASNNLTISFNNITTSGANATGIFLNSSSTVNNVSTNTIVTSGGDGHGIFLRSSSVLNNISNNNITTSGQNAYGIYALLSSDSNTFTSNTVITSGTTADAVRIQTSSNYFNLNTFNTYGSSAIGAFLAANGINFISNNITTSNSSSYAVQLQGSINNLTTNTFVTSGASAYVIYLQSAANNNITSNIITTNGSGSYGVLLVTSTSNSIVSNTINSTGTSNRGFFLLTGSNTNWITNNNIISDGVASVAIYNQDSNSNTIFSNILTCADSSGRGLILQSSSHSNATNNTIITTGDNGHALMVTYLTNTNNTISSNNIRATGDSALGVYADSATNSLFTLNTVRTGNSSGRGFSLILGSNNNTLSSNTIITNGSSGFGILIDDSNGTSVTSNTINTTGSSGTAIRITSASANNTLSSNTINASGSTAHGITLIAAGTGNSMLSNTVRVSGSASMGVVINNSNASTVTSNAIQIGGSGIFGISLDTSSQFNILTSNTVTGATIAGITLFSSANNNNLSNNVVENNTAGILLGQTNAGQTVSGNILTNNTIKDNTQFNLKLQDSLNNIFNESNIPPTITLDVFLFGRINFTQNLTFQNNLNFSDVVSITYNRTFVNSTARTELNKTADLILRNLTLAYPRVHFDNTDQNIFTFCARPRCFNQSYNGSDFTFNVSQFTTYVARENVAPIVNLISPNSGNNTLFNRDVNLTWNFSDPENDTVIHFDINLTSLTAPNQFFENATNDTNFTTPQLRVDTVYIWTVRAFDGYAKGPFNATPFNFTIPSSVIINLTNDTVNFGNLTAGRTNDTTTNSPGPFLLQNDGNVLTDVSLFALGQLFSAAALNTSYWQYRFGNSTTEPGAVNESSSRTAINFTNVPGPVASNATYVFGNLNFSNAKDEAEIELKVTVPDTENSGSKNANITFMGELGE